MEYKPFGIMLGLLGNLMLALAIEKLVGTANCGSFGQPACPTGLGGYIIMIPAGIIISVAAIFFGGGPLIFMGVFVSIGVGSLIAGFTSDFPGMGSFPFVFGGLFAGIPLALTAWFVISTRGRRRQAVDLLAAGGRGAGTITAVKDTGMTVNDNPRVQITMQVQPEDGSPSFNLTKKVIVSRLAIPRAGDRVPVLYDPADRGNWMFASDAEPAVRT